MIKKIFALILVALVLSGATCTEKTVSESQENIPEQKYDSDDSSEDDPYSSGEDESQEEE